MGTNFLCLECGETRELFIGQILTRPKCNGCLAPLHRGVAAGRVASFAPSSSGFGLWWLGLVGLIIVWAMVDRSPSSPKPDDSGAYEYAAPAEPTEVPSFDEPAIPVATGELHFSGYGERVAPLTVRTRMGSNFFVKLVDRTTNRVALTFYITGGDRLELLVPLGDYDLKYATGDVWYGTEYLFGPDTRYAAADSVFSFTMDDAGYNGYTVELYRQVNGNLETKPISPSEF